MKVISFVSQKGVSGKSTLSISCALEAFSKKSKVLLVDMDPQKTLEQWYQNRENQLPQLVSISKSDELGKTINFALGQKFEFVFIDTPGKNDPAVASAIRFSDFCIVPCRPTSFDMKATPETVNTIKRLNKNFCFVVNQTMSRGSRIKECINGLSILGAVSSVYLPTRIAYQDAHSIGLSVKEYDEGGKADLDIINFWKWVTNYINKVKA